VGDDVRRPGQCRDYESGDPSAWVDAQKKTLGASERDEQQRQHFQQRITQRPADTFVILDESGTNLNLTPRYARAPRGQRAYGSAPRNTPRNTTVVAALSTRGMGPTMTLPGALDTTAFEVYLEHFLVPWLQPGQVVVLDNLSVHKSGRVQAMIEAAGCELWYLPAYSPDLSPIELAFAKLKEILRRAKARTQDALDAAIALALEQISASDAHGYFTHCGYLVHATLAQ
jgi:transposase